MLGNKRPISFTFLAISNLLYLKNDFPKVCREQLSLQCAILATVKREQEHINCQLVCCGFDNCRVCLYGSRHRGHAAAVLDGEGRTLEMLKVGCLVSLRANK